MFTYTKNHLKLFLSSLLFLVAFLFLGCDPDKQDAPEPLAAVGEANMGPNRPNSAYHNKILADIRSATVQYKNGTEQALAKGYTTISHCVTSPLGGMGYHYVNMGLIDAVVNPLQPEALLYEPQKNGRLQLIAVEYIVDGTAWHKLHDDPPMLGDQVFDNYMVVDQFNPLGFPHYQLHAWVWKHNPAGMHTAFNPNVNCDYAAHAD
jgi:hypothetical protein